MTRTAKPWRGAHRDGAFAADESHVEPGILTEAYAHEYEPQAEARKPWDTPSIVHHGEINPDGWH